MRIIPYENYAKINYLPHFLGWKTADLFLKDFLDFSPRLRNQLTILVNQPAIVKIH